MISTSEFFSFESSSSFYVMSAIIGIPDVHSNMGYWSNADCFNFFAVYSTLFTTSSCIGSSIYSSLWIYFPACKDMNKFPLFHLIPSMIYQGWFYDSCCSLFLYIPWRKTQRILYSYWNTGLDFYSSILLDPSLLLMLPFCVK